MRLVEIYDEEIVDEYNACVYCGDAARSDFNYRGCCGEVHSELVYILENGEHVRQEDVYIIKGPRPLNDEAKLQLEQDKKLDLYRGK